jgi:N-acetylneuraminic acid mutarotase
MNGWNEILVRGGFPSVNGHRANVVGQHVYISGGSASQQSQQNPTEFCDDIRKFETADKSLSVVTPENFPRLLFHATTVTPTRKILLFGGKHIKPSTFYLYDPGQSINSFAFFSKRFEILMTETHATMFTFFRNQFLHITITVRRSYRL